jgi:hypothetical protein
VWCGAECHHLRKLTPGSDFPAEYLLAVGELPRTFSGWEILQAGDDGGSSHDESWIVCRKPDPPEVTERMIGDQWLVDVSEL